MTDERQIATKFAHLWIAERFAIAWTTTNKGPDAKAVKTKGWNESPVVTGNLEAVAGQIAHRLQTKNPALVAKASNLILVDCDSVEDVTAFKAFDPPITRSVYTRQGRHYIYRAPADHDGKFHGIYFEGGAVTPKSDCYLITPPAIHPSGHLYQWVNEEIPIAELPMDVYRAMIASAGHQTQEQEAAMVDDDDAKLVPGRRHAALTSLIGKMRKSGSGYDVALAAAYELNARRFDPPKKQADIKAVVDDIYERYPADSADLAVPKSKYGTSGVINLADVEARSIEFAVRPILQWSAFHLLTGRGGAGKGTWTADFARSVTRGELEGMEGKGKRIIFVSSEDNIEIDVRPRCDVAGADPSLVNVVKHVEIDGDQNPLDLSDREHQAWLRWLVSEAHDDVGALVIDPVSNHLGAADTNSEGEVRNALAFLNDFSADHHLIVIGVRHLKKDAASGALASVLGSTAWVDLPRAVIVMARDDISETRYHMELVKGNRGPLKEGGRVYDLELVDVMGLKEPVTRLVYQPEVRPKSTDDLLGPQTKQTKAKMALLDVLNADDQEAEEVKAQVAGIIDCSDSTVWHAFKALEHEHLAGSRTDGFGEERKTYWFLLPKADW